MEIVDLKPIDRAAKIRADLQTLANQVINNFCELSDLLLEVWKYQYHKQYDYSSFSEYVEAELDIKERKAYYMVQTAKVVHNLGIEWDEVRAIGWRKMGAITPLLTYDNKDELIKDAKELNLTNLTEKLKASKKGSDLNAEAPTRMTVQMDEDQNSIVKAAIDYAKRYEEARSNSDAIVKICYDWLQDKDI